MFILSVRTIVVVGVAVSSTENHVEQADDYENSHSCMYLKIKLQLLIYLVLFVAYELGDSLFS